MDDRQVRREYESIKRFVTAAVARGKIDHDAVLERYDAGEYGLEFQEGHALGFKRCAELILGYIEDGEKVAAESTTITIVKEEVE